MAMSVKEKILIGVALFLGLCGLMVGIIAIPFLNSL